MQDGAMGTDDPCRPGIRNSYGAISMTTTLRLFFVSALLCALAAPVAAVRAQGPKPPAPRPRPGLAIAPFVLPSSLRDHYTSDYLTDRLFQEAQNGLRYEPKLASNDLKRIIAQFRDEGTVGAEPPTGKAVVEMAGARFLLLPSISRVGARWSVSAKLVDLLDTGRIRIFEAGSEAGGPERVPDLTKGLWAQIDKVVCLHSHKLDVGEPVNFSFTTDGMWVAAVSRNVPAFGHHMFRILDAESGIQWKELDMDPPIHNSAFSPDGKRLAIAGSDPTRIWDVGGGRGLSFLRGHDATIWDIAFSPDGRRLATAASDKAAQIWDVESGRQLKALGPHGDQVRIVTFSPDGRTLATGSFDKTARIWDVESGQELAVFRGYADSVRSLAFSPDGKLLATADGKSPARIWDVDIRKQLPALRGDKGPVIWVVFAPNGKHLATAAEDHTVRIWDYRGGRELCLLRTQDPYVSRLAFGPDGCWLATASTADTRQRGPTTVQMWEIYPTD
jgi:WD40 repeat protein